MEIEVLTIVDENYGDFYKPHMLIAMPHCSFKCCKEASIPTTVCQNHEWVRYPKVHLTEKDICERYLKNPLTSAIVFGGLEPFDTFDEVLQIARTLRFTYHCDDTMVVYTGYYPDELDQIKLGALTLLGNVIIKYGRYIPNRPHKYDDVLKIELVSDNQYAIQY